MAEIVDEVVSDGPTQKTSAGFTNRRAVVNEDFDLSGAPIAGKRGGTGIEDEDLSAHGAARSQRPMKASTLALLDKLEQPETEETEDEEAPAPAAKAVEPETPAEQKTEETPAPTAELDEMRGEFERVSAANRELVERVEQLEKAPRGAELSERHKHLVDADAMYLDDSIGAIRKLIAGVLDVAPDSKDVDAEMKLLYADLTSREIDVPLEAAHKAARDAARTRQLLARDKRERKAESEQQTKRASSDDDTRKADSAAAYITNRLPSIKSETGTAFADEFPLLMGLAEHFDGMPPAKLLWKALEREHKAGTIDCAKLGETGALRAVARMIEDHYTSLGDLFAKVKPASSDTAKREAAPSAEQASKEKRQGTAARTITNARSSVAPATPPAKKPAAPAAEERPKFKSKKEAQDWALRHLPD